MVGQVYGRANCTRAGLRDWTKGRGRRARRGRLEVQHGGRVPRARPSGVPGVETGPVSAGTRRCLTDDDVSRSGRGQPKDAPNRPASASSPDNCTVPLWEISTL